jgi:hypothetical protein
LVNGPIGKIPLITQENKMDKDKLIGLLSKAAARSIKEQKDLSPETLSAMLEDLSEDLEHCVDSVDDLMSMMGEGESKDYPAVAKSKGLPEIQGGLVKMSMSVTVGGRLTTHEDEEVIKSKRNKKTSKDYEPDDEELEKINALSNIDLGPGDVYVFTLRSADTIVDRSADQFTAKALNDMASMSVDKPFLRDHSWKTDSVVGKIFDASVSSKRLIQKVYVPKTAKNEDMYMGMLSGIYNKVSVGFALAPQDYVCSMCMKSVYSMDCPHYPGQTDKVTGEMCVGMIKGVKDYYEVSNVAVPAQPAAGIRRTETKSIDRIPSDNLGEKSVDPTKAPEAVIEATAPVVETPAPEVAKAAEAPAVVEKTASELVMEAQTAFLTSLKSIVESLSEVATELKSATAAKAVEEKTAKEESTEEIARKLAATSVAPTETTQAAKISVSQPGWSKSWFTSLQPKQDQ